MSKLLTVFGATGNQGGSVIAAVLANSKLSAEYKIRGITRDPSKPAGQKLADKGVELVKADLNDKDSVKKATEGSHAVFGVTNYWEFLDKNKEIAQGQNIADACKANGVSLFIWSCVPHAGRMTDGKLSHLPHFDSKADVAQYVRDNNIPASFLCAGCFMENFLSMVQKSDDGDTLNINLHPDTKIPLFAAADDAGKFVAGILLNQPALLGKDIYGATGWFTPTEIVAAIEKVTGRKTTFNELPDKVFESFLPKAIGEELMETFMLVRDYAYYGPGGDKIVEESLKSLILGAVYGRQADNLGRIHAKGYQSMMGFRSISGGRKADRAECLQERYDGEEKEKEKVVMQTVTGTWTLPFTAYLLLLTNRVVYQRIKNKQWIGSHIDPKKDGDSDNPDPLFLESRCHMNFLENVPLAFVLAAIAELNGGNRTVLNYAMAALFAVRIGHVEIGLRGKGTMASGRPLGLFATQGVLAGLAAYGTYLVKGYWGY
ncbi:MAG: hypothetical protein Q9220_006046 [cf. Caloplaca sp. 1 TL-2023]